MKTSAWLVFMAVVLQGLPALAQKINFDFGVYTLSATPPSDSTNTSSVKISSPGIYSVSANFEMRPQFEIGVGYSVFLSKGFTGDLGFGPDFMGYYFPFAPGSELKTKTSIVEYREIEHFRPFGYLSFHQRQFQSVQSSYSGFGIGGGAEIQWKPEIGFRALFRMMSLAGPSGAKTTYMDFIGGLQLHF